MHESLVKFLFTVHAEAEFAQLRLAESMLARFSSAPALLDHLTQLSRNLEETDHVYAALVRAVQAGRAARVAQALLLCGLWPGLDRVYRRRIRLFRDRGDELTSAIFGAFTELVAQVDLDSVTRVAATLVRSTARDAMYVFRREWAKHSSLVDRLDEPELVDLAVHPLEGPGGDDEGEHEDPIDAVRGVDAPPYSIAFAATFWLEFVDLHRALLPVLGEDTDLVLRVVVLDDRQRRVAMDMGLAVATARKRFQRARRRLRAHLRGEMPEVLNAAKKS